MGCGTSSSAEDENPNNDNTNNYDKRNSNDDGRGNNRDDNTTDIKPDPTPDPDLDRDKDNNEREDTRVDIVVDPEPDEGGPNHRDRGPKRNGHDDDDGLGLKYTTKDFRTDPGPFYEDEPPRGRRMWEDEEFPPYLALEEFNRNNLSWKRPTEIRDNPVLFSEGTTRFDIGQGSMGTCWFLSTLANLSEHPQLRERVVKPDDYSPETGVFHCRFWKFGKWVDVFIDDYLPIIYDRQIWGARSDTDENEMWVSLIEKAFAKLHGSYNSIYGGQASDAYLALTGGIGEKIDFEDQEVEPNKIFRRVRNALYTDAMLTCTVPGKFDGQNGLVGEHAYSLTGAEIVRYSDGETEKLFRIRNPWGNTEWTRRWSDGSREWDTIPPNSIPRVNIDDGEFWISLHDFMKYFSQTTICSITPDFDMDGCSDSLNHVLRIYGQWLGENAAGFQQRLSNPKYIFTVPDEGMSEDGLVPLVVQLIQKTAHRKKDKISIRCDLYKVHGSKRKGRRPQYVLELLGEVTNVFTAAIQCAFRHRVEPGEYVVVPCTMNPGEEKEFLIRVFAPCHLEHCSDIKRDAILMSCEMETSMEVERRSIDLRTSEIFFGSWSGDNAGGQISNKDTYANNPQFVFTVPDRGSLVPVIFHLLQSQEGEQFPIGLRVYPLTKPPPVDIYYLYDTYDDCPEPEEGGTFVITWDLDVKYALRPGQYMLLIHTDKPYSEKDYVLFVRSSAHLNIQGFQTGE